MDGFDGIRFAVQILQWWPIIHQ